MYCPKYSVTSTKISLIGVIRGIFVTPVGYIIDPVTPAGYIIDPGGVYRSIYPRSEPGSSTIQLPAQNGRWLAEMAQIVSYHGINGL